MKQELFRIENGTKGDLLKQFHIQLYKGEITNLVFNNIHEKNMLLDILYGYKCFDYGRIYYQERLINKIQTAAVLGQYVKVITDKNYLLDTLSIGENIFLARKQVRDVWAGHSRYNEKTERVFQELGIVLDVGKKVKELTLLERIQVELAKAYICGQELIFLTSMATFLNAEDLGRLWGLLNFLKQQELSIVLLGPYEDMEHKYIDTVMIVKNGRITLVKDNKNCDFKMVHSVLYGKEGSARDQLSFLKDTNAVNRDHSIRFQHLSTDRLRDFSIEVKKGEIVKLFCIDEPDCDELARVISGKAEITGGRLEQQGGQAELKKQFISLSHNIGIVEENPVEKSLFEDMSVIDNLCILLSNKMDGMWGIRKYQESVKRTLKNILHRSVYQKTLSELDGCELEKLVYCRWLLYAPDLVICIRPFAESDLMIRETVKEMIRLLSERGIGVLVVTSSIAEFQFCIGKEQYMKQGQMISNEEAYRLLYR